MQGPFAKWVHTHQFSPDTEGTSFLLDHVEYQPPLGFLGRALAGRYIQNKLEHVFSFRHARTQNDLKRYHPYSGKPPLKIVMDGASGMIGNALRTFLSCGGHQIRSMVRGPPKLESSEIFCDPYHGEVDKTALESTDVLIHLAGENIGAGKWTTKRKEEILKSRREGTRFLSETMASLKHPPRVILCHPPSAFTAIEGLRN